MLEELDSPILLHGNETTAYRDPAALYHDKTFYLFSTIVETEHDGLIYLYTGVSTSRDLKVWSKPRIITPKGQHLNYSSPGNVIRFGDEWVLCLQTYPKPGYRRGDEVSWGDQDARIWIMRSRDLVHWGSPELLRVKGPDVPREKMGRMIDPYLVRDKDEPRKWWCFYKQNGVSFSSSCDLKDWTWGGRTDSGENVCVLLDRGEYLLFHSPHNGIGMKRSPDLRQWRDAGELITLGQESWPWAETRLTAGCVVDLRNEPGIGKYLMFFHGSGPGKKKTQDNVCANCSIGIAWSADLATWHWPGAPSAEPGPSSVRGASPSIPDPNTALTNRERFVRLFNGEPVDRAPFLDIMGFWGSSIERWKTEGLDEDATPDTVRKMIGFDGCRGYELPIKGFIWPEFEREVLEEDGDRILVRNRWGGVEQDAKGSELMPVTVSGPVKDRASWEQIKQRLDPDTPGRFPGNWDGVSREAREGGEPVYAGDLPVGFFGAPRELLGFQRQALLFYDYPELMHEILDALCDLWIALYARAQEDVPLDWFFIWEDMCFKGGPLIGPDLFREFLLPRYRRLTAALRRGGCGHIMVDSDGDERPLVPLWMEGGVNIVFPWETQFGLDVTEVRRRFPKLGMMGGINKFALASGREAIDEELGKIPFMLEQGRYIPGLDHGVPPDVSWDDYRYFYDRLREMIWKYPPRPAS